MTTECGKANAQQRRNSNLTESKRSTITPSQSRLYGITLLGVAHLTHCRKPPPSHRQHCFQTMNPRSLKIMLQLHGGSRSSRNVCGSQRCIQTLLLMLIFKRFNASHRIALPDCLGMIHFWQLLKNGTGSRCVKLSITVCKLLLRLPRHC